MKKKVIIFILIIFLVIGLGVGSFFAVEYYLSDKEETEVIETNKIYDDLDYVFVKEEKILGEEHSCLDGGIEMILPQINLNNEDALSFNEELEERFNNNINDFKFENNNTCFYTAVIFTYRDYLNGDILSFVLEELSVNGSYGNVRYEVRNFDVKENRLLTREDLLESKGLTLSTFRTKVEKAIDDYYEKELADLYPCDAIDTECLERMEQDIVQTKASIDYNRIVLFLNEKGNLTIIIDVYSPGHDDYMKRTLEIT